MLTHRFYAAEVDARDLTESRLLAAFERRRGGDPPVAFLAFSDSVELVHTAPSHRRRGLAAALLALAREDVPELVRSSDLSVDGVAWGRAVGLPVPGPEEDVEHVRDVEVAWAASSVYLLLTHVGPEDLLWRRPLRVRRGGGARRRRGLSPPPVS